MRKWGKKLQIEMFRLIFLDRLTFLKTTHFYIFNHEISIQEKNNVLNNALKNDGKVKGISIPGLCIKLCQFPLRISLIQCKEQATCLCSVCVEVGRFRHQPLVM